MIRPRSVKVPPSRNINSSRPSSRSTFFSRKEAPSQAAIQDVDNETTRMKSGWSIGLNIPVSVLGIAPSLLHVGKWAARMTYQTSDSEFLHEVHKPLRGAGGFDSHACRPLKVGIILSHDAAFVLQSRVHYLAGAGIQHRQRLLASVQIASHNSHLGLPR